MDLCSLWKNRGELLEIYSQIWKPVKDAYANGTLDDREKEYMCKKFWTVIDPMLAKAAKKQK